MEMDYNSMTTIFKWTKINKKLHRATTMDYNNIIMNFKCTKIKQKITNGNHDVLLFVMYSNTAIEITKMLMVMMIHPDGNGIIHYMKHNRQNTSSSSEFVTFNGPKQL
jgi:hypothetical protein